MRRNLPAIIGAVLGIALGLFVAVYLPMKRNYDECGKVTLCNSTPTHKGEEG